MSLIAIGFNHQRMPLDTLGKVVIPTQQVKTALTALQKETTAKGAVILSTCNRCEIYAETDSSEQADELLDWLCDYVKTTREIVDKYAFSYHDEAAAVHLMRVAGSIDSMIVGEPQILGQVKNAYQAAMENGSANGFLIRLFEKAFSVAKQVRRQTELGKYPVSYASAVLELTQKIFADLSTKRVLFIGAGEMIALTANYFRDCQIGGITIAGRSRTKADALAKQFNGDAIELAQINERLADYDIVVSGTASEHPILSCNDVAQAMKKRRHRPLCIADIALPCDIESEAEKLEDVYLYSMEKLANIVDANKQARLHAARQAESLITDKAREYFDWVSSRKVNATVTLLRDNADEIRAETLKKALEMLKSGKSPEQTLEYLSSTLTNRLLHVPTQTLKHAAEQEHFELLALIRHKLEKTE